MNLYRTFIVGLLLGVASLILMGCNTVPLPESTPAPQGATATMTTVSTATTLATSTATPPTPPTAEPTSDAFPPGPKLVYAENLHDGTVTFWAVSPADPTYRRRLTTAADPIDFGVQASLSHDGTMIAYTAMPLTPGHNRHIAELWVVNVDGSNRRMLASPVDIGRWVNYPIWSPDDRYLVFKRQTAKEAPYVQQISLVDVQTGVESILVESSVADWEAEFTSWIDPLDWFPDSRYFYYQKANEMWRADITGENSAEYVASMEDLTACYFFSPDGQHLLCKVLKQRDPSLYAVATIDVEHDSRDYITEGLSSKSGYYIPIWNPDGQGITVNIPPQAEQGAELCVIGLEAGERQSLASNTDDHYVPRSWSPDGEWLAAQQYSSPEGDVYLINRSGSPVNHLPASGAISILGWLTGDLPEAAE